jgi:SpoVK/Ycf46/Vps4 family AAA+-type ATPase
LETVADVAAVASSREESASQKLFEARFRLSVLNHAQIPQATMQYALSKIRKSVQASKISHYEIIILYNI